MVAGSCPKAVIVAKPLFYRSGLSLGGQLWDLASTTWTVPSAHLARLRLVARQTKLPLHCIMAGVELEKYAIDHEMSHQQYSEKRSLANTTQSWKSSAKSVAIYNVAASLFCTAPSVLRTVWDHGRWKLSQSCYIYIVAFVVQIWSQFGRTIVGPCQYNLNSAVRTFGKTTVAPKTNKTTTA